MGERNCLSAEARLGVMWSCSPSRSIFLVSRGGPHTYEGSVLWAQPHPQDLEAASQGVISATGFELEESCRVGSLGVIRDGLVYVEFRENDGQKRRVSFAGISGVGFVRGQLPLFLFLLDKVRSRVSL